MTGLRASILGLRLSASTERDAVARALQLGCTLFDLGHEDADNAALLDAASSAAAGVNGATAAQQHNAALLGLELQARPAVAPPVTVTLRSAATTQGGVRAAVAAVRERLMLPPRRPAGAHPASPPLPSPPHLVLLLSDPSLQCLEDVFFGGDAPTAAVYQELRDAGQVQATGISCCAEANDHHHDVINRFLQDPSFLADVVDTGYATDWSLQHCRHLSHGHQGDETISADNQLHAAAHLGAAVLLDHHAGAATDPTGAAAAFCAERDISLEGLALYMEVGPPAPSPPISATFRDADTVADVDVWVGHLEAHASQASAYAQAARDWMGATTTEDEEDTV